MDEYQVPEYSYGACFIGPPGSGKTTCVFTLQEMCSKLKRNTIVINLDPANDNIPGKVDFDIQSIITVKDVMKEHSLGPNGALLYCMETLADNVHQVTNAIKPLIKPTTYFLIDFPGQVELYTHSDSMQRFISEFSKDLNVKLATVNLVDCVLASSKQGYLGQSLMALGMMLRLYTPHLNVISKFDLVQNQNVEIPFSTTSCDFDDMICSGMPSPLHKAIVDLLNGYDLVSYAFFTTKDETSVIEIIQLIDKAVGCSWML